MKIPAICNDLIVNYVKTSTGYHCSPVTPKEVRQLRTLLDSSIKIKAAGGIKTPQNAQDLIEAGANRLGASAGLEIIKL